MREKEAMRKATEVNGGEVVVRRNPESDRFRPESRFLRKILAAGLPAWLISTAAGCEAGPAPGNTSRDSLGIAIVESAAPQWEEGRGWRIDETPIVDLAESGSGEMHLFGRVRDFLRTGSGNLVVADWPSEQIRVYGPDGGFIRAFGGPGEGPGEFQGLMHVVLTPEDRILGLGYMAGGSVAEFDLDSGLVGTFRFLEGANPIRHPLPSEILWGIDAGYSVQEGGLEAGLQRTPATILNLSEDRTSTRSFATVPGWEHIVVPEGDLFPLMQRSTHVVPTAQGDVVVGTADGLEYSVLDGESGDARLIARISGISLAVTREEIDRERQTRMGPDPSPFTRDLVSRMPDPDEKPAYESMLVDAEGNVWAPRCFKWAG